MKCTSIEPGQVLSSATYHPPVLRVVCRYPFDGHDADPRWVVEHINQPGRTVEIVEEKSLRRRDVLVTIPLTAPLAGRQ
jgi:hypothetical protein